MKKISEIQLNINEYLNEDNLFGIVNVYNEDILLEKRIGRLPNSQLEIHIEGGEGYVPHMHICRKTGKNVVLRIKLLTNEYFREKDDVKNKLSRSERKALNDFLSSPRPGEKKLTQYHYILNAWNLFNPSHKVNINIPQPDYSSIREPGK